MTRGAACRGVRGETLLPALGLAALAAGLVAGGALVGGLGVAVTAGILALAVAVTSARALARRLEALAAAREAAEACERDLAASHEQLRLANLQLARDVEDLLARNREFVLLGELNALLQGCDGVTEAEGVLWDALPELFPRLVGTLYMRARDGGPVIPAASWGAVAAAPAYPFGTGECSALHGCRQHVAGADDPARPCPHLAARPGWSSACIPLRSHPATTGVLTLLVEGEIPDAALQLARAVTDSIGLSLANLRLRESLRKQSISDPLTGLHNRRFMQETLTHELLRARRSGQPVGLCMIDIDHFKPFNDVHGHHAGDAVLLEVGRFLREAVRASDVVCRYGGEEFTVILPESPLEATVELAEALVRSCRALRVSHLGRPLGPITISIGVAEYPTHTADPDALLRLADAALYAAKQEGRDRVVVARGPAPLALTVGVTAA